MRTTKGNVESAFKYLCQALGKRIATKYNDVGAWRLDHMAGYGGWNIEQISNEGGAVSHPFGSDRMQAEAMYNACWMAIRAVEMSKKDAEVLA